MKATVERPRLLSALIVGATGIHVLRVVTAFERRRVLTIRTDTIADACERIPVDMPRVVLVLIPPASDTERDDLVDRALAVGARIIYLDPALHDEAFRGILESAVDAALEQRREREQDEADSDESAATDGALPDELDDGWDA